jgi:hypothetical protein
MTTIPLAIESRWHWLRSARFDLTLVVLLPTLAAMTAFTVTANPNLFLPVLVIDLWVLGYHHVIATYTRLMFDKTSLAQSRWLIFGLFPAVAAVTALIASFLGLWAIITIYFYWQWFHYTRQSWGISRAYRGKDQNGRYEDGWLDQAIFYALPVLGILHRSHQDQGTFLGMELRVVPVPEWIVQAAAVATAALLAVWVVRRVQAWREGRLAAAHTLYMASHFFIFAIGYLAISDLTYGWLAINIWHNAQYILFVWLFNTRRFKDGVDPQAHFLSYISQPNRLWLYLLACIAITGVIYWGVLKTLDQLIVSGLLGTIVLYQIVNFHHYIVDSVIWKMRKTPLRRTLGLSDSV